MIALARFIFINIKTNIYWLGLLLSQGISKLKYFGKGLVHNMAQLPFGILKQLGILKIFFLFVFFLEDKKCLQYLQSKYCLNISGLFDSARMQRRLMLQPIQLVKLQTHMDFPNLISQYYFSMPLVYIQCDFFLHKLYM